MTNDKLSLAAVNVVEFVDGEAVIPDPTGQGRHVSEVRLFTSPGFFYDGTYITVDEEWIEDRIRAYEVLSAHGWKAAILEEHRWQGDRQGDVLHYFVHRTTDRVEMRAWLAWNAQPEVAKANIRAGKWQGLSAGLYTVEDSNTGLILPHAPLEVSLTAAPRITAFGSEQILNGGYMPTLKETLAAIEAKFEAIEARLPAPEPEEQPGTTAEESPADLMNALLNSAEGSKGFEALIEGFDVPEDMLATARKLYDENPAMLEMTLNQAFKPIANKTNAPGGATNPAGKTGKGSQAGKVITMHQVDKEATEKDVDPLDLADEYEAKGFTIKGA